jgi:HSP20 family molecular chaperone IbpA
MLLRGVGELILGWPVRGRIREITPIRMRLFPDVPAAARIYVAQTGTTQTEEGKERAVADELTERRPFSDFLRKEGGPVLRAEVPPIKPEDMKIEVEDDVLTVSGARSDGLLEVTIPVPKAEQRQRVEVKAGGQ